MPLEHLNPNQLAKPGAYTQVVRAQGATSVYIAGQVATDAGGNLVGPGDFEAQARRAYQNVAAALASVGASFDQVAKTTVYIVDYSPAVFDALIRARLSVIKGKLPANTLIGVQALAAPEYLIEVEAVAILD